MLEHRGRLFLHSNKNKAQGFSLPHIGGALTTKSLFSIFVYGSSLCDFREDVKCN